MKCQNCDGAGGILGDRCRWCRGTGVFPPVGREGMKAIYQGKVWRLGDNLNEAELQRDGEPTLTLDWGTKGLVVDPTDAQINAAELWAFGEDVEP